MNIYMLGNGFDLHYSFPTNYINFMNTMMFLCDNADGQFETVATLFGNHDLQKADKNISWCYDKYKDYYPYANVDQSKLQDIVLKAAANSWFQYFRKTLNQDVPWIDFELEIAHVLNILSGVFVDSDNIEEYGNSIMLDHDGVEAAWRAVLDCFKLGDFDTSENIPEEKNGNVWLPMDSSGREYFYFRDDLHSGKKTLDRGKIVTELAASLKEFSKILSWYMWQFVEVPIERMVSENKVRPDCLFRQPGVVVTFNYTNTFEQLDKHNKHTVHHIHGTTATETDNILLETGIVLGINADEDDKSDSVDTTFLPFKKYYQRIVKKTDNSYIQFIRDTIEEKAIDNKLHKTQEDEYHALVGRCPQYRLYVFGHSLNETDKDAIKELFDIAELIVVFYHNDYALSQYVNNLVKIYGKEEFDQLRISKRLDFVHASKLDDREYLERIGAIPKVKVVEPD